MQNLPLPSYSYCIDVNNQVKASDPGVISGYLNMSVDNRTWQRRWFSVHSDFVLYSFKAHQVRSPLFSVFRGLLFVVLAYRYIAITTLAIIAVFLEYLCQFLIDLHQTYRHSSVPKNTPPCIF